MNDLPDEVIDVLPCGCILHLFPKLGTSLTDDSRCRDKEVVRRAWEMMREIVYFPLQGRKHKG